MYRTSIFRTRTRSLVWTGVTVTVTVTATAALLATPAGAGPTGNGYPGEEPFSRPCFMVQSHWNEALDGAQPLCPGPSSEPHVSSASGTPDCLGQRIMSDVHWERLARACTPQQPTAQQRGAAEGRLGAYGRIPDHTP